MKMTHRIYKKSRAWALILCSTAALLLAGTRIVLAELIKTGQDFPDMAQTQLEGALPELKGKIILVDFWASWCGPCRVSFPYLQKISEEYQDKGVVVLGISVDDKKKDMEKFAAKFKASFPIARDAKHLLVSKVGIETMPSSVLVDRQGKVRFIHGGFHGDETAAQMKKELDQLLKEAKP
jgi:thiol-disulfide isomerase/thioredoxin